MDRTPANIRDVAARAGCSIATVSRVATGNGPVSIAMQKKVVDAALALGFPLAQPAAARRPVLGVLLPSLTNPVFAGALAGIEHCARANGLSVIIGQSNYRAEDEMTVIAALIAERPMGLVMTVCDPATSQVFARVARQGIPAAMIYNEGVLDGFGSVSVDNRGAMRKLIEELVACGHHSILFIGGRFASSDRATHRYRGYCDAMKAAGFQAFAAVEVDFIDATEDIDLTTALDEYHPTAIVVSNDLLAVTVIASLRRLGLRVPQDVSVTGFDGIDLARHISPKITTMIQPSRTMGVLAASMVLDIATGRRRPAHIRADFTFARGETIAQAQPDLCTRSSFLHETETSSP